MVLKIKKATKYDIDFIKQIETESLLSSWTKADYLKETNRKDSLFYVARQASTIVGFILARLIITKQTASNFSEFEIYNLAVKVGSRHQKVGSQLLAKIFEYAEAKNNYKIFLEVRKSNVPATQFYLKNGFEIIGTRPSFYTNPVEDALLMCRNKNSLKNT